MRDPAGGNWLLLSDSMMHFMWKFVITIMAQLEVTWSEIHAVCRGGSEACSQKYLAAERCQQDGQVTHVTVLDWLWLTPV